VVLLVDRRQVILLVGLFINKSMSVFGRMVGSTIHVVNKDSYSRRKKKNWL